MGLGRAVVAGAARRAWLALPRQPLPSRDSAAGSALVALGVVLGFPLLTALALRDLPAAHGAVIVGLLPAATAVAAVVGAGERPSRGFWARGRGRPGGRARPSPPRRARARLRRGDLLLLAAVALGALGYAEGAALARDLGGWQTICWALVLSLPLTVAVRARGGARPTAG